MVDSNGFVPEGYEAYRRETIVRIDLAGGIRR